MTPAPQTHPTDRGRRLALRVTSILATLVAGGFLLRAGHVFSDHGLPGVAWHFAPAAAAAAVAILMELRIASLADRPKPVETRRRTLVIATVVTMVLAGAILLASGHALDEFGWIDAGPIALIGLLAFEASLLFERRAVFAGSGGVGQHRA